MIVFLGVMLILIAAMLLPMGYQQFTRKYYVAAGFSLVIALALIVAGIMVLWHSV